MQFSPVAADAFQTLQLNAGIIVDGFTPSTGVIGNICAANKTLRKRRRDRQECA